MERFKLVTSVHLILIKEGKVLLLRRYHTGYKDGNYSVVAGHIDGNESVIKAMQREAMEEAGIKIQETDLKIVHVMHRKSEDRENIDYFFDSRTPKSSTTSVPPPVLSAQRRKNTPRKRTMPCGKIRSCVPNTSVP